MAVKWVLALLVVSSTFMIHLQQLQVQMELMISYQLSIFHRVKEVSYLVISFTITLRPQTHCSLEMVLVLL